MKKVINGRKYDTETARELCSYCYSNRSDFNYVMETLYLKKNGEFFMFGQGGAWSRYGSPYGNNAWVAGSKLVPYTEDEAKKFVEEFGSCELYEELFGEIEE